MKIWRLVAGILSIVLSMIVLLQSCAAGVSNALSENGEVSGSAGFLVAIAMIAGGIVSIVVRKSVGKGGSIALIVIFGLAALIGFANYGSYSDLAIWSGWCLINAGLAVVALITGKKKKDAIDNGTEQQ
ncbi:hypothetical protein SAMN04487770_13631 [Butyrivibrio sp. ob235]|uniref:hypothetical protein n=1 Tax=Butyrivibrio sp. ob235 TaxID=1761780 RepID=UPI0008B73D94|nr:hypothetical protein [Butyrivibrio sp. ob235]SEM38759.1 hypothetical protein SAMN04487770_13631 [Butyrivibrio sp. ob235]